MYNRFVLSYNHSLAVAKLNVFSVSFREVGQHSTMRVLNVAEKNDAAKNISLLLSEGLMSGRKGLSVFNKIYEFQCQALNTSCKMVMTSVSGHLLNYDFMNNYRSWNRVNPLSLFDAPIERNCIPKHKLIKKNLQDEVKNCSALIIWTDCDREGENIGYEIIEICQEVVPNIPFYRAVFSEITKVSISKALKNLQKPNPCINNAVNVRMELDLRIGAAFTRYQSIHLRKAFPVALKDTLISFGSCQFPTLGFIVERFKAVADFVSEPFWKICVKHQIENMSVNFEWKKNHLFDKLACEVLYDKCIESNLAKVENVEQKKAVKTRPKPMTTVDLEQLSSSKLGIVAIESLKIAEKLYTKGFISYPRTETNIFPKELDLTPLVQMHVSDPSWGEFARNILKDGPNPMQGKSTDHAHPPIHPIKYTNTLEGNDRKVYELITRHFLACLSKDAKGMQTKVDIDIAGEKFTAKGLVITEKNYLDVYPYEKWAEKKIHSYETNNTFKPTISMNQGETSPPDLLTESDLIGLMRKHGIGTDATYADHIEKIKERYYVGLQNKYFVPRTLGMGLVESYNNMGFEMSDPRLRAELEVDLKSICDNEKSPNEVLKKYIAKYKEILEGVMKKGECLTETIQNYLQVKAMPIEMDNLFECQNKVKREFVMACPSCDSPMNMIAKDSSENYIVCANYSNCKKILLFTSIVTGVSVTNNTCPKCGPKTRLLEFKLNGESCGLPDPYVCCIRGCDPNVSKLVYENSKNKIASTTETFWKTANQNGGGKLTRDSGFSSDNPFSEDFLADENEIPKCKCGWPALKLMVNKAGPNKGRFFYKCGSRGNNSRKTCNFFEWENKLAAGSRRDQKGGIKNNPETDDDKLINCYCFLPSKRYTVMKEGKNKGREFYSCGNTSGEKCAFFKWFKD